MRYSFIVLPISLFFFPLLRRSSPPLPFILPFCFCTYNINRFLYDTLVKLECKFKLGEKREGKSRRRKKLTHTHTHTHTSYTAWMSLKRCDWLCLAKVHFLFVGIFLSIDRSVVSLLTVSVFRIQIGREGESQIEAKSQCKIVKLLFVNIFMDWVRVDNFVSVFIFIVATFLPRTRISSERKKSKSELKMVGKAREKNLSETAIPFHHSTFICIQNAV